MRARAASFTGVYRFPTSTSRQGVLPNIRTAARWRLWRQPGAVRQRRGWTPASGSAWTAGTSGIATLNPGEPTGTPRSDARSSARDPGTLDAVRTSTAGKYKGIGCGVKSTGLATARSKAATSNPRVDGPLLEIFNCYPIWARGVTARCRRCPGDRPLHRHHAVTWDTAREKCGETGARAHASCAAAQGCPRSWGRSGVAPLSTVGRDTTTSASNFTTRPGPPESISIDHPSDVHYRPRSSC